MSDKRYPTRMHEVLGVETGERFEIPNYAGEVYVDNYGYLFSVFENDLVSGPRVCEAINHPERLTRRPRLTEEQVQVMKALVTIGCLWLVQDNDCYTYAAVNKPTKRSEHWSTDAESFTIYVDRPSGCLISLVSWSDPAPLDIVQTLRDAGVEVGE